MTMPPMIHNEKYDQHTAYQHTNSAHTILTIFYALTL